MFGQNFNHTKTIKLVVLLIAAWLVGGCGSFDSRLIGFSLHNDTGETLFNPWIKTNKNKYAKKIILKDEKRRKNVFFKKDNSKNDIVDICTIVNKCTIDEISKYLIKTGKKKDFPDITVRE